MSENYYHILGLDNFASSDEIKKAYRQLAKKYHPDRNEGDRNAEEKFKQISKAYEVLSHPEKKMMIDEHLRYSEPIPESRFSDYRPEYTTATRQYTPTAWMFGKIFIILFIMATVLIPLTLLYQSSVNAYERGLEAYQRGDHFEALGSLNSAMTMFGGRSTQAGIKGSEISIYDMRHYKQGLYFADRGLEYAEKEGDIARLHYLKAMAYKGLKDFDAAVTELNSSETFHYSRDSVELHKGLLYAFSLMKFQAGAESFDYLIHKGIHLQTAWFGKAWCMQNQGLNEEAIAGYTQVLELNPDHTLSYYYRGLNHAALADSTRACHDFEMAMVLGYAKAIDRYRHHCAR